MKLAGDTRLVAAYSRDMARAEGFAQKHGMPRAYSSIDDMLSDSDVDAVFIASPNSLHAEHTMMAAREGKHALVEKPMAVSVSEAQDMVRVCRDNGVKLGVGFQLRHHPGHIKARQLIQENVLGFISMAQAQWCLGDRGVVETPPRTGLREWWGQPRMIGGASILMGTGVHALGLLYFLLRQPISEVSAITDGQTSSAPLENRAAVAVRFADGTVGTVCCGRYMPDTENDATIYGSGGRISLRGTLWEALTGAMDVASETVELSEQYDYNQLTLYQLQTETFNSAIQSGTEFHASGEDGLHIVSVTSAIIEAASTGRSVKVASPV